MEVSGGASHSVASYYVQLVHTLLYYLRLHFILRSFMPHILFLLPAPFPVQLCAVFGTLVIPIAYMTVHELTRSCTAAFIASTLLICGECSPPPPSTVGLPTELHHSIGSLIDGAHPGLKTDRDYLDCYCLKTFETAKGKKEGDDLFLSLCCFKGLQTVTAQTIYRSSDLGEPYLSGSLCCDEAQILSKSQTHTAILPINQTEVVWSL